MLIFLNIHGSFFMYDLAPCHKAKKAENFFSENNAQVLDWPGDLPYLNPIENCWAYIKRKLRQYDISSVPRFTGSLKKMWLHDMDVNYFKILSSSIPKGILLVIKAKGSITNY